MDWHKAHTAIREYVFRIQTPGGFGTGFLCGYNEGRRLALIATAWHVVEHADAWREPIRLTHEASGETAFLPDADRIIFPDVSRDTAAILFSIRGGDGERFAEHLPEKTLSLMEPDKYKKIGNPVAWVGYPAVAPNYLCFFRGYISAFRHDTDAYLIDGSR